MVLAKLFIDHAWWLAFLLIIYILLCLTRFGQFLNKSKYWLMACFLLGCYYYVANDLSNQTQMESTKQEAKIVGEVISGVEQTGDLIKLDLQINNVNGKAIQEKVLCRIKRRTPSDNQIQELKSGSILSFRGRFLEPEMAGNPGALDYRKFLYFKRIHWIVEVESLSSVRIHPAPWYSPRKILNNWQDDLIHVTEENFSPELAPLMKGLLLGIRSDFDPEMSDIYKQTGIAHVLAISGLHMTVLSVSLLFLIQLLGVSKQTAVMITGVLIPFYVILAGATPSIVRSGIMSTIILAGSYLRRPTDTFNVWGTALFCMLVWDPYQLWDVGFQLSFGCVWGLIYFSSRLGTALQFLGTKAGTYLSVGMAAQLCSYPFSIFYFHHYFLLSFFVNLLFIPLYSLLFIPIGFLILGLGMFHPGLGYLLSRILDHVYRWMSEILIQISDFSWADCFIREPSLWWLAVYYIVLVHGLWIMKERMILWMILLSIISVWPAFHLFEGSDKVTVTFLDVGQGDAIVIETQTQTTLIDAGGMNTTTKRIYDAGRGVVIPFLQWRGINHLDFVVATHGDLDHIGGMLSILKKVPVRNFIRNGKTPTTIEERDLLKFLENHHIPIYSAKRGWSWGDGEEVTWTVMNPPESPITDSDNNHSIVLMLQAYGHRILFTGDLEKEGESNLLAWKQFPTESIDVLKVGHHGSRSSTTAEWVSSLRPAISILSVGRKNRYGHPHQETLQALEQVESKIYRTDQQGAITIEINKRGLNIYPFRQQSGPFVRQ
ncbi:MAG TPA: DNA internalization-related competence protein ComEC/Rec2 [Bacillota bacterium]|nr:DNA internalization-related competence protein ComEC/Rec2 [Bacillota bacterium]